MAHENDDDLKSLISLGVVVAIGYGMYKFVKKYSSHLQGDLISEKDFPSEKKFSKTSILKKNRS
jgi:hypothetical protein